MKNTIILPLALLFGLPVLAGGHPRAGATVKVAGPSRSAGPKAKGPLHPVNLNTATLTELMQLPKVGAKTAERIVTWRKEHGGFRRPEELMHVKGIGEKGFQRLKAHLTVTGAVASATPARK